MTSEVQVIPLEKIRFDGDAQMRVETDGAYQDELFALFDEENPAWPKELPPVDVCFDGEDYWPWDGLHRLGGAKEAGCAYIPARVREGTRTDAQWLACGANKTHGKRRLPGDVAKAARRAWGLAIALYPNRQITVREIASHVGCHHSTASDHDPRKTKKQATSQGGHVGSRQDGQGGEEIEPPARNVPKWAEEAAGELCDHSEEGQANTPSTDKELITRLDSIRDKELIVRLDAIRDSIDRLENVLAAAKISEGTRLCLKREIDLLAIRLCDLWMKKESEERVLDSLYSPALK